MPSTMAAYGTGDLHQMICHCVGNVYPLQGPETQRCPGKASAVFPLLYVTGHFLHIRRHFETCHLDICFPLVF